jgi:hypothetical protein
MLFIIASQLRAQASRAAGSFKGSLHPAEGSHKRLVARVAQIRALYEWRVYPPKLSSAAVGDDTGKRWEAPAGHDLIA